MTSSSQRNGDNTLTNQNEDSTMIRNDSDDQSDEISLVSATSMAQASQINDERISTDQSDDILLLSDIVDDKLNATLLTTDTLSFPTSERNEPLPVPASDALSYQFSAQVSFFDQSSLRLSYIVTASEILPELIKRCLSSMDVRVKSTTLERAVVQVCTDDGDLDQQWQETYNFYRNDRKCDDPDRIKDELYQSLRALINDERDIMIGLDSLSSLKDLLLTAMKICADPNFLLEIRTGLGGTEDSLTLRTPAYAVAGLDLLQRLIQLRENFPAIQSASGSETIPTVMLSEPPVLTFFCAYTAAVKVNNFNQQIARSHAHGMLSFIKKYVDHYHPNLSQYVRYELDHEDTYQEELLRRINRRYEKDYHDEHMKRSFITQARQHGGNEHTAATYVSMHLIIFKDIVDINTFRTLFHSLEGNHQPQVLYDCVITIGGPVEQRFNDARYTIRQAFQRRTQRNREENFHFPLSIRLLSEVGQTPVYYHNRSGEITVHQILNDNNTDWISTIETYRDIKKDITILREDIGICLLKSIWNPIPHRDPRDILTWKNKISTIVNLFMEIWREHTKGIAHKRCTDLIRNETAIDQICQHYGWLNDPNNAVFLILNDILNLLEKGFPSRFGHLKEGRHINTLYPADKLKFTIINHLNLILNQILVEFVRNKMS